MTKTPQPDRRWRWVLARSLPPRDRAFLLDELDDAFVRRASRDGERAAQRWYREEVMGFALRVPDRGFRGFKHVLGGWMMDGVRQLLQVTRSLRRSPGFATLATLTLALGIGANALIFAVADHAILRALPYPDSDELVAVMEGWGTSLGTLEILERDLTTVSAIGGALDATGMTLEVEGAPARRVSVSLATPSYLTAIGVAPVLGRPFRPEEAEPGRGGVVLLSADFFADSYGADPSVLGTSILLDDERYEIVGVLPEGFDLPSARNDLWIPATVDGSPANVGYHWGMGAFSMVARMAPGATPELVKEDLLSAQETARLANPLWTPPPGFWDDAVISTLQEARSRWARTPLMVLVGAVMVVLLVVCANVANLLLSRSLARQRDLAVRTALGAGQGQMARQQLLEVVVLAGMGTLVGLALASGGLELLRPLLPPEIPGREGIALDLRVIGVTGVIALFVAVIAGALPAFRVTRQSPGDFLRDAGRGRTASVGRRRTTTFLVTAQLAAAVVLVAGSGLLGRSLYNLSRVDPGFESEGRVTARLDLPPGLPGGAEARALFFQQLEETLEADPALRDVALASSIPFGTEWESMAVFIPGVTEDPNDLPVVQQRRVTPDFFAVADIPLRAGRGFERSDELGSTEVAVIDQTFADRFFPGVDPVGRTIRYPWRDATDIQVVGVVGPTTDDDLASDAEPTVWFPLGQFTNRLMIGHGIVVARGGADLTASLGALQTRARDFDERIAVSELVTYPDLLRDSLASARLMSMLLLIFALSTLVLGCVGVYGVASFSARERVREIGVRMTLGAHPSEIRQRMFRESLALALPGGILGIAAAALSGRVLASFLYGVSSFDPLTFTVTPLVLVLAAMAATYLPARRATRVNPVEVLRAE
ncbi:MAG: ABC transporter permease [Gemmatimonadota bacterium]